MADLSLNSLSVDAIQADLRGSEEERLKKQAFNNVIRQREAAAIRGDGGKKSSSSSSSSSSSKPAPAPKTEKPDPQKEVKELAEHIQKVESFMNNPKLGPLLRGIAIPRNGNLAEYKVCLEQIRNKLGEGLAGSTIRQTYTSFMGMVLPFLETQSVPEAIRLPYNSSKVLENAVQQGAFSMEFEELAIEYSRFFRRGPVVRLLMGTVGTLLEYKKLYESGIIDPMTGQMKPEIMEAIRQAQQAEAAQSSVPPPQPQPEQQAQEFHMPPPMKVYPEPSQAVYSHIDSAPSAPEYGLPTISSREHPLTPVFTEEEIKPEPVTIMPTPAPKKSSRGKGRQL